jgi:hypothetical protein
MLVIDVVWVCKAAAVVASKQVVAECVDSKVDQKWAALSTRKLKIPCCEVRGKPMTSSD